MKNQSNILQEINTHKAVLNGNLIDIVEKGIDFEDMHYPEEVLYSIPADEKEDLFAIFERLEENNRINRAEFASAMVN